MFIAALFIIAKLWKQPKCSTNDELRKHGNEILLFAGKWMEVVNIILSNISQIQKGKGHICSLICRIYPIQIQAIL
jgi:hypothetical protein